MQPKFPLRISRTSVWSHNTGYVGAVGKHSEISPQARARKASIDNCLIKVVSALNNMEKKEVQKLEKSKRDIQNSMLAYIERVKEINAKRLCSSSADCSDINSGYSTSTLNSSRLRNSLSSNSSQTSSDSERITLRKRKLSPVKSRRLSLPKVGPSEKKTLQQRRYSSVSNSTITINSFPESRPKLPDSQLQSLSSITCDNMQNSEDKTKMSVENKYDVRISPFPYDSTDETEGSGSNSSHKSQSPTQPRKRISYKQYKEEREIEKERMLMRKKMSEIDNFDHKKEILRQQAQQKRAALLLEKARQEALKNKKDIWNTFCYSFAMEELLKKSDPLAFTASEKDFVSKVEVDKDGTIKQTLGPAVLTIIGVDELNNYHGMRIKWSAKYRQQNTEESEQSEEVSFLPPITVGGQNQTFSRQVTQEHEQLQTEKMFDAQSTVSAVSVDG